jgi:hypothetical protein
MINGKIDRTVPCRNCGGLCKIVTFMSLNGHIQHPVCVWDACNEEMIADQSMPDPTGDNR